MKRTSIRRRRDHSQMIVGICLIVASLGVLGTMLTLAVRYDCYVNPPRVFTVVHALACPTSH